MKPAIRVLIAIAATGVSLKAAPFLAVGDSAELFLTGTTGIRADDNILLASNKTSDVIYNVAPGFDFVYGHNALYSGHIYYQESWDFYSDNHKLNTDLSSVGLDGSYNDQKTKVHYAGSWAQLAQNTVDVRANNLVRRDVGNVLLNGEVSVTDKSSIAAGVNYNTVDYKRAGFDSSKITEVPLDYYYEVTPKTDLSAGLTFRDTKLDTGIDSKDYFYNIGARGEFTPKLTGTVAVGYTVRDLSAGPSRNTFGIDSSLAYALDEKTSVQFGVTNDFGVSGQGDTQRNLTATVGVQSKISPNLSVGTNLTYRSIQYFGTLGRSDDYFEGSVNATYIVNAIVSFTGSYTYRDYSTKLVDSSFTNNVFAIAANFRY